MRYLADVSENDVYSHWKRVEKSLPHHQVRNDILDATFPNDVVWRMAQVEDFDIPKIWLLPSKDMGPMTKDDFYLLDAVDVYPTFNDLDLPGNDSHKRRYDNLSKMPDGFDTRLIVLSPTFNNGPFMIVDGNHRAVLLQVQKRLVGSFIFVGASQLMPKHSWMKHIIPRYIKKIV